MPAFRVAALPAALAIATTLALLPAALEGQALEPGARVRLTQANGARFQGILEAIEADSARITAAEGKRVALPLADVHRVEVSLGQRRQFWKHLAVTVASMAAVGGAIGGATYEPCDEDVLFGCLLSPGDRGEAVVWGAMLGGAAGVPVGIVVGAAVRREQWARVSHPAGRPRQVSIRPIIGERIGASATLSF